MSCFCNSPRPFCLLRPLTGTTGQRGPTGPTGPTGATGPAFNQNATLYNSAIQNATSGTALSFPTILTNNGLVIDNSNITVPTTGTYIVSYTVNATTGATTPDKVGIAINGTLSTPTENLLSATEPISGSYVLNLTADDVLTLVPTVAAQRSVTATGGPSVTFTVVRIA